MKSNTLPLAALTALAIAGTASAQMTPTALAPSENPATSTAPLERQPGVASAQAVDPAPGASGPYVGHSESAFYDVQARIDRVQTRVDGLTGAKRVQANKQLASIKSELSTQKARHGTVRDWDRENINKRLDALESRFGIGGQASPSDAAN